MNGWLPFALVLIVGFTWLVTARQHGRLFRLFLTRYPHEATNLIPYAISNWRHPEQIIFFFRKSSAPLLKADPELWKKRQSVKALFWLSVLVPLTLMTALSVYAIQQSHQWHRP
jgi:hypothetical protein